jgi:hypothetical protein
MTDRPKFNPHWLIAVVLLATAAAYAPGLHGGFLFDDFGNLPALGLGGAVDTWPKFWRYITSGGADPTGRPLTLLSFLLDSNNWPATPLPFKRTNVLLHLCNGIILVFLLQQLGIASFGNAQRNRIKMAALLGTAFWILHPLFVSTTLYIVQREAMLPATFTLVGLILWLRGRSAIQHGEVARGLLWIALGLGGCTTLGVMSKANGILLPSLALVIEYVLLRHSTEWRKLSRLTLPNPRPGDKPLPPAEMSVERSWLIYQRALFVCGWVPATLVAGYLVNSAWKGFADGVASLRPWTMGQRLLTEPRVIMQYLDLLWIPRAFTPGLFNDQVRASASLWSPMTTLPAIVAVLLFIAGGWLVRKRSPALAAAILFYFVGQSIESSTIPLELYFEHRNYLPAMLMFWPLALWLCGVRQSSFPRATMKKSLKSQHIHAEAFYPFSPDWLRGMLAVVLLSAIALMTYTSAKLWGNTSVQSEVWAAINPNSPRAQVNAALIEMSAGNPSAAINRTTSLLRSRPAEVQLAFTLVTARCIMGGLPPSELAEARRAMASARDPGSMIVQWFESTIPTAIAGHCRGLDLHALDGLIDAGFSNPNLMKIGGRQQDLLHLKGYMALIRHDPGEALRYFNASLDQDVRPDAALEQAAMLGSAGYPRWGLAHLDHYADVRRLEAVPAFGMPRVHAWVLQRQHYWPNEIAHLRDTLQQDANKKTEIDK